MILYNCTIDVNHATCVQLDCNYVLDFNYFDNETAKLSSTKTPYLCLPSLKNKYDINYKKLIR